jgi:DNA-binding beta-propeller fold protein YncE
MAKRLAEDSASVEQLPQPAGHSLLKRQISVPTAQALAGIAVSENGTIHVVDEGNHCVMSLRGDGTASRVFGAEHLVRPYGIAINNSGGMLAVTDPSSNSVLLFAEARGTLITRLEDDVLKAPTGVAFTADDRLVIAHEGGVQVRDLSELILIDYLDAGESPGEFNSPRSVSVDTQTGCIFVMDTRIQVFDQHMSFLLSFNTERRKGGRMSTPMAATASKDTCYVFKAENSWLSTEDVRPAGVIKLPPGANARGMAMLRTRLVVALYGQQQICDFDLSVK